MTILMILTVMRRFAVLRENKKKISCGKSQSWQTALTVCHLPRKRKISDISQVKELREKLTVNFEPDFLGNRAVSETIVRLTDVVAPVMPIRLDCDYIDQNSDCG